jgi:hypothetical protein
MDGTAFILTITYQWHKVGSSVLTVIYSASAILAEDAVHTSSRGIFSEFRKTIAGICMLMHRAL